MSMLFCIAQAILAIVLQFKELAPTQARPVAVQTTK